MSLMYVLPAVIRKGGLADCRAYLDTTVLDVSESTVTVPETTTLLDHQTVPTIVTTIITEDTTVVRTFSTSSTLTTDIGSTTTVSTVPNPWQNPVAPPVYAREVTPVVPE